VAIFRQPSILRNLICPLATRLKSGPAPRFRSTASLHAPAKLLVKSFNRGRGAQRLPLHFGEGKEREQLVATFAQTGHRARATLGPRALEGGAGDTSRVNIGRVDDPVEVQLMDPAPLDRGPGPHEPDGASQPSITFARVA